MNKKLMLGIAVLILLSVTVIAQTQTTRDTAVRERQSRLSGYILDMPIMKAETNYFASDGTEWVVIFWESNWTSNRITHYISNRIHFLADTPKIKIQAEVQKQANETAWIESQYNQIEFPTNRSDVDTNTGGKP